MSEEMDVACKNLYESIKKITIEMFNLLVKPIIDFEKKWDINIGAKNIPFSLIDEVTVEMKTLEKQIYRNIKKCIVFGRTTSGKSTLINALLSENILPASYGSTSNYFVEIKGSSKDHNYLLVDGSDREHPVNDITKLNEDLENQNLEDRSLIHLFYDRRRCELLNEDVVIIDTPGLDIDINLDTCIEDLCKETDVILLLVNSMGDLSLTDKDVISKHKNIFSKLTVLIIYTFWDVVQVKDRNGRLKEKHINNAKIFLCNELNYSEKRARNSIYFVSGEERLGIVSFKSTVNSVINNELLRERNVAFDAFFQFLKKKLSENAVHRKYNYLKQIYLKTSSIIVHSESALHQMSLKRGELVKKIKLSLPDEDEMNSKINEEISKILASGFDDFIEKGKEEVKLNENEVKTKKDYTNLSLEMKEEELSQKLHVLFEDKIDTCLMELKSKIIELIHDEDDEINSIRKEIFEKLYFSTYFDFKKQKSYIDNEALKTNLKEIRQKVRTGTIVTVCSTAGFAVLGIATGGASILAAGLVELGVIVGSVLGTLGVTAAAVGGGSSFGIIKALKNPFMAFYKNNISNIKEIWDEFGVALLNSYLVFVEDLPDNVDRLISPLKTNFMKMQNDLNGLRVELEIFHNYSMVS